VPVPRWLLLGLGVLAAVLIGRMMHATIADGSRPKPAAAPDSSPPASAVPPSEPAAPPIYLTIVMPEAPASPASLAVGAPSAAGNVYAAGVPGQVATPIYASTFWRSDPTRSAPTQMTYPREVAFGSVPMLVRYLGDAASGSVPMLVRYLGDAASGSVPTQVRYVGGAASGSVPTQVRYVGGAASGSVPTQVRYVGGAASGSDPAQVRYPGNFPLGFVPTQPRNVGDPSGALTGSGPVEIHGPHSVDGLSVIANGNHIVIANNGAIVSVGDNTVLTANTGDAGASGVIALDPVDSVVTSGSSSVSGSAGGLAPTTPGLPTNPQGSQSVSAATSSASAGGGSDTRAVAIAGYENKALEVVGNDNLLTSDDSNIFQNRAGHLNGNTGDTDTSGLNVVDTTRSVVSSGDSGASRDPPPVTQPSVMPSPVPLGSTPAPGVATASVAGANSTATATGADSLVIGGDGVIDKGMTVHGDRNVTTSDDGNVVVGGVGDANAQIGDSKASGAVVMDVTDSEITSGSSSLPASQPVGTQVPDPIPGGGPTSQPPTLP
jgi:hypothetical protein